MPLPDRATSEAHALLLVVEADERLPHFYVRHPGLSGLAGELRTYLERGVAELSAGRISQERAGRRALRVFHLLRGLRWLLDEQQPVASAGPPED